MTRTFSMRKSNVLARLRAGEAVCSIKLNTADPATAEVAAMSGCDCIWLDLEHTAMNYENLANQIRAAKMYDTDTLVRVRRGSYSDLIYPLELDATGIMVPHVMNADEARQIVRSTRFHPLGRRPVDGGNADGKYARISTLEYMQSANHERFIVLQIEDPEAMDNLEEIAAVDGYDMLLFGPGDFSHALGIPGQMGDSRIIDARRKVAEVAVAHGKFAGSVMGGVSDFQELMDMGYRFVNISADVLILSAGFDEKVAQFRKAKPAV